MCHGDCKPRNSQAALLKAGRGLYFTKFAEDIQEGERENDPQHRFRGASPSQQHQHHPNCERLDRKFWGWGQHQWEQEELSRGSVSSGYYRLNLLTILF